MNDAKPQNKSKLPRFLRSKRFWITFNVLALLAAAVLISLPYGIDYLTEQWLMSHGLDRAKVEDIDFNPFTGTLVLHNLRAHIANTQVLKIPEARLRFSWRPLLRKRARIENLTIKDTSIIVEHEEKGSWRVGGLALALAKTVTDKPGEPAWGFGLNQLEILNSQVQHVGDGPQVKLTINRATVSRLRTWDREQAARLDLAGKVNDGTLKMGADFFPFASQPRASGTMELTGISLADIAELAPAHLKGLQGELSLASKLELRKEDTGIRLSHRGKLSLERLEKKLEGTDHTVRSKEKGAYVQVGEIAWEGELDYGNQNLANPLQLAGDVEMRDLQVADLLKVSRAEFQDVVLVKLREISIDTVKLSGISSLLRRNAKGEWQQLDELYVPFKGSRQSAAAKSQPPVVLRVGKASLVDEGEFRLEDRGVSPPLEITVKVTEAGLTGLDSDNSEKPAPVKLIGKIGKYTDVSIQGEITRFSQRPNLDLVANIDDLDLALLSGYTVEMIGYLVKSGHLDADIELRSVEGELDGKTVLSIRDAEVSPADEKTMERFERQLKVPLPTALAVLSDSKKAIALEVPITGDVTDPKFDFSDAFQQALVKGMTKAAVSYLKYLFQPYGTMMAVVELGIKAGKKITALRLDPVFFEPNSAELSPETTTYVERVAELMKTRPQIRIKLCGMATAADKGDQKETSEKKESEQPAHSEEVPDTTKAETFPEKVQPLGADEEHLRELVRQRAERIKEYLVKNYGIEDDRLLVCQPEYDPREDAEPRVELLI